MLLIIAGFQRNEINAKGIKTLITCKLKLIIDDLSICGNKYN